MLVDATEKENNAGPGAKHEGGGWRMESGNGGTETATAP